MGVSSEGKLLLFLCVSSSSEVQDDYRREKSCSPLLTVCVGKWIVREFYLAFEISSSLYSSYWTVGTLMDNGWDFSGATVKAACWVVCWLECMSLYCYLYGNVLQVLWIVIFLTYLSPRLLIPKSRTSSKKINGMAVHEGTRNQVLV